MYSLPCMGGSLGGGSSSWQTWLFWGKFGALGSGSPLLELFSFGTLALPRREVWIGLREVSALSRSGLARSSAERSAFRSWAFQG